MRIEDGLGKGFYAEVNSDGELKVQSIADTPQHQASHKFGDAYQILSDGISISTTEQPVLFLKNIHNTKDLVITYIRFESIGAAAASIDSNFKVKVQGTYTSGGVSSNPINVNLGSNKSAQCDSYNGGSSLIIGETNSKIIDVNYQANSMQTYNKQGALILNTGDSIYITHKGSTVAGNIFARISFYYTDKV